jgi:DNA-binding CsgD family transcriptional regulator
VGVRSGTGSADAPSSKGTLSPRERQVLDLLSQGLSGTEIAERLFLSPETVRTHVRNAMAKLGASTRSQAVAIALQRAEIGEEGADARSAEEEAAPRAPPGTANARRTRDTAELAPTLRAKGLEATLGAVLAGLATLYDVDGGAIFLVDDDGLTLRRVALVGGGGSPRDAILQDEESLALGDGALGRAALERRPQIVRMPGHPAGLAAIAAPMYGDNRLVGLLCLAARPSRPLGRSELLLLQAFSSRLAEVIVAGGEGSAARLKEALERFRSSWSGAGR